MNKISIIGGGNVGGSIAFAIAMQQLGSIALIDRKLDMAKGKALDIAQSCSAIGKHSTLLGTDDYAAIEGSKVVIITAGIARGDPNMTRDMLLNTNADIIKDIANNVSRHCPNAFVIMVTNPLDVMTYHFYKNSGLPRNNVVGMAGTLDSARFATFLAEALQISAEDIDAMVLGGHGDSMVPLISHTSVGGISLQKLVDDGIISINTVDNIINRTKNGGAELVSLMGTSAYYAPALSTVKIAKSYLMNERRLLPCSAYLSGEYGANDIFAGVPTIIGKDGAKIFEIDLNTHEQEMLQSSIKSVRVVIDTLKPS